MSELETRPVPGFDRYLARADGEIVRKHDGKVMARKRKGAYWEVQLYRDGIQRQRRLHSLIIAAFHGEQPSRFVWATFKNGDRLDCRAENLVWMKGREKQCRGHYGEASHGAKLTTEQVIKALDRVAKGELPRRVAESYGVTVTTIRQILNGKTWPHVPRPATLKPLKLRPVYEPVTPVAA